MVCSTSWSGSSALLRGRQAGARGRRLCWNPGGGHGEGGGGGRPRPGKEVRRMLIWGHGWFFLGVGV